MRYEDVFGNSYDRECLEHAEEALTEAFTVRNRLQVAVAVAVGLLELGDAAGALKTLREVNDLGSPNPGAE